MLLGSPPISGAHERTSRRGPTFKRPSPPSARREKGSSEMPIGFSVDGRAVKTDEEGDTPLLWVLRDEIGLKGTKFGCGIGMCGACTVHVGGRATRSCITTVRAVAGAAITTIEGLDPAGQHPLQKAWIELQVP